MRKYLNRFPIFLIKIYQLTLSPDHGFLNGILVRSKCRFYPSCSDYALESIRQYGLLKAVMVSCARIIRCNPWSRGGYDPLAVKE